MLSSRSESESESESKIPEFKPIIPLFDNPLVEVFINYMRTISADEDFVATPEYKNKLRGYITTFGEQLKTFVREQQRVDIYPYLYVFTRVMALFAETNGGPAETQQMYLNIIEQEPVDELLLVFHWQLGMLDNIINCIQYRLYIILTNREEFLTFNNMVFTLISQNMEDGCLLSATIEFSVKILWELNGNMELHDPIRRLIFLEQETEEVLAIVIVEPEEAPVQGELRAPLPLVDETDSNKEEEKKQNGTQSEAIDEHSKREGEEKPILPQPHEANDKAPEVDDEEKQNAKSGEAPVTENGEAPLVTNIEEEEEEEPEPVSVQSPPVAEVQNEIITQEEEEEEELPVQLPVTPIETQVIPQRDETARIDLGEPKGKEEEDKKENGI